MNGAKASEQREFHENLRERFSHNLFLDMIKPTTIRAYRFDNPCLCKIAAFFVCPVNQLILRQVYY